MLPGSYQDPKVDGRRAKLGEITYGVWNEDAYQLYMDVETLRLLGDQLDPESLRADKVAKALEQFTLEADFEQPLDKRIESYRAAREAVKPALEAVNGSTAPVFLRHRQRPSRPRVGSGRCTRRTARPRARSPRSCA